LVDGESGEVTVRSDSVEADPFRAANVVEAVARGFSPPRTFKLLEEDMVLEIIDLKHYTGKSENSKERIKGSLEAATSSLEIMGGLYIAPLCISSVHFSNGMNTHPDPLPFQGRGERPHADCGQER
jgi:rRNA processing protein Krr1/Pno1